MRQNVRKAGTKSARFHQNVLPPNRRLSLWGGGCTFPGGGCREPQTKTPPGSLLLCHIYSYRTKVRHLRTGVLSGYQGTRKLESIPHLDENPVHYRDRPQEPYVLEVSEKIEWEDGPMAQAAARLRL